MPIYYQVNDELKEAMRARDKARTQALRNIRAAFIEAMKIDASTTLTDVQCIAVLRKLAKQRAESIAAYEAGGRADLVAEERGELAVIDGFLPRQADEATTREWVRSAIASTGASGAKDMGRVMGVVMKEHKDEVDGKLAKRLAEELLR